VWPRLYDGNIARNTTRDHALGRGPYRQLRRRGGGGIRGRLAVVPPVVLALVIALLALAGFGAVTAFAFFASDLPSPEDLARDPLAQTTNVFDRDAKTLLYQFEVERREVVSLNSVPQLVVDATISAEDKSFWTNPGVDIGGIVRAFNANASSGTISQGGSTITQQLIKTRLLGDEPTFTRKIKEAILAVEATRTFSKKQILEMYLNQIYYGNQAYGIEAAAKTYFDQPDLMKLTLGQMAMLAGLAQRPSDYDPVQNPSAAKARRAATPVRVSASAGVLPYARESAPSATARSAATVSRCSAGTGACSSPASRSAVSSTAHAQV